MENNRNNIYLPETEAGLLIMQAIRSDIRMEMLDLMDYAKKISSGSITIEFLEQVLRGLANPDMREYNFREKSYLNAHQIASWKSCKELLPEEGQEVLVSSDKWTGKDEYQVGKLSRNWFSKELYTDVVKKQVLKKELFVKADNGEHYTVNKTGKPDFWWLDSITNEIISDLKIDSDYWMPIIPLSKEKNAL